MSLKGLTMLNSIRINELPGAIKKIALPFAETLKIYEGNKFNDLIEASHHIPFDFFLVDQTNVGIIERHFLVGLAMPMKCDDFVDPVLAFTSISDTEYEECKKLVIKYGEKQEEVKKKKGSRIIEPFKHGLKNLMPWNRKN